MEADLVTNWIWKVRLKFLARVAERTQEKRGGR